MHQFAFNKDLPLSPTELPGGNPRSIPAWARKETFAKISHVALTLYCFVAALSIGVTQSLLIPVIVYWLFLCLRNGLTGLKHAVENTAMVKPVMAWFLVCLLSGIWGADVPHSVTETVKSSLFLAFPFMVSCSLLWSRIPADQLLFRCLQYASAFLAGQTVAGIHTLVSVGGGFPIWNKIPGAVTESGQLVLVLPLFVGILLAHHQSKKDRSIVTPQTKNIAAELIRSGAAALVILLTWPFNSGDWSANSSATVKLLASSASAVAILFLVYPLLRYSKQFFVYIFRDQSISLAGKLALFVASASILTDTFVLNLKRGPWFGAFVQLLIFGLVYSKKVLPAFIAGILLVFCCITPVRTRLLDSKDHFLIEGGRQSMWTLGGELVQSYPLGIGFANSRIMRVLDPTLPTSHRHMHNNLLQVTVETGWLGLGVYLWWIGSVLVLAFRGWKEHHFAPLPHQKGISYLFASLGIAIFGWQCAGIVEYNFGDSEIRIIALFFMGMLIALSKVCGTRRESADRKLS